jgi:hypothetical protein
MAVRHCGGSGVCLSQRAVEVLEQIGWIFDPYR